MRPRYMTATRSHTWRTTDMLCATNSIVRPSRARRSASRLSTVACTDTSSAETGSSGIRISGSGGSARGAGPVGDQDLGLERERARDRDALALPARELPRVGVERAGRQPDEVEQ